MNVPQIWCEDLVRIYSTDGIEVQALQGLNLSIDEGDVVALGGAPGRASRRCWESCPATTGPPAGGRVSPGWS